jgi:Holliday junction resolvase RusA-like endonuclease
VSGTLRQTEPGEEFVLTVHRNPGGHSRPHKTQKGKNVKVKGLSVNDWMGLDWRFRQQLKDELERIVKKDATDQNCPAFLLGRPYVQATYYFKDRRSRDWANYGKQVIDAVVQAGVLVDDNDKAIDLDRNRIIEGDNNPRIVITIRDTRPAIRQEGD